MKESQVYTIELRAKGEDVVYCEGEREYHLDGSTTVCNLL
jgi:hypothetical protein